MKNILYALILMTFLFSCQKKQAPTVTYVPRILKSYEKFNSVHEGTDSIFSIIIHKNEVNTSEVKEELNVKFKDTLVKIQINKADPNSATDKFSFAQFINTQKTTLLVQIADNSGLAAPCYLLALKDGKLDVVSLYRPSSGKFDTRFTNGINRLGRTGYIVNNDFFITNVNAKVYLIKRQHPEERIQGEFILNSPDKSTLVFLTANSLYQVNYSSDEVHDEQFPKSAPQSAADISNWIKNNFGWQKSKKGIAFLKYADSDRVVDIKDFR